MGCHHKVSVAHFLHTSNVGQDIEKGIRLFNLKFCFAVFQPVTYMDATLEQIPPIPVRKGSIEWPSPLTFEGEWLDKNTYACIREVNFCGRQTRLLRYNLELGMGQARPNRHDQTDAGDDRNGFRRGFSDSSKLSSVNNLRFKMVGSVSLYITRVDYTMARY